MRRNILGLTAMVMFAVLILPSVSAETLFSDDFSGNLSQWEGVEIGEWIINATDVALQDNVINTSSPNLYVIGNFTDTEEVTLYVEHRAQPSVTTGSVTSRFGFYMNDSYYVHMGCILGSGFGTTEWCGVIDRSDGDNLYIRDFNYTYVPDMVWYYMKLYVNGTDYSFKVWNESDSEPAEWMYSGTLKAEIVTPYTIEIYTSASQVGNFGQFDNILLTTPDEVVPYVPVVQQLPILGLIPLLIGIALIAGVTLPLISGRKEIDLSLLVTGAIMIMIGIVFIGVIYVV